MRLARGKNSVPQYTQHGSHRAAPHTGTAEGEYELYHIENDRDRYRQEKFEAVPDKENGRLYYWNITEGITQWERPAGSLHEHLPVMWMEVLCQAGDVSASWLTEDRPYWFDNVGNVTWFDPGGPFAPCTLELAMTKKGRGIHYYESDGVVELDFSFGGVGGGVDAAGVMMVSYGANIHAPPPPPVPDPPPKPEVKFRGNEASSDVFAAALKGSSADCRPVEDREASGITRDSLVTQSGQAKPKPELELTVGARVVVPSGYWGTLRWVGEIYGKHGLWAGVELDKPHGKNTGEVHTTAGVVQMFNCEPKHGLFLHLEAMRQAQEAVKVFREMDDLGEPGVVSLEDMACYLTDYGFTSQEMIDLFLRLDANHDHVITLQEFVRGYGTWTDEAQAHEAEGLLAPRKTPISD